MDQAHAEGLEFDTASPFWRAKAGKAKGISGEPSVISSGFAAALLTSVAALPWTSVDAESGPTGAMET